MVDWNERRVYDWCFLLDSAGGGGFTESEINCFYFRWSLAVSAGRYDRYYLSE